MLCTVCHAVSSAIDSLMLLEKAIVVRSVHWCPSGWLRRCALAMRLQYILAWVVLVRAWHVDTAVSTDLIFLALPMSETQIWCSLPLWHSRVMYFGRHLVIHISMSLCCLTQLLAAVITGLGRSSILRELLLLLVDPFRLSWLVWFWFSILFGLPE